MSGLDHPDVGQWLARLDAEAGVRPEDRRAELRAGIDEYLADAVNGSADPDAAARRAVADLGEPADLVAEAGGYAVPHRETPASPDEGADADAGPPWLEVTTITVLPSPVVLVTSMRPACARIACCTRYRPSPYPPIALDRPLRKNCSPM